MIDKPFVLSDIRIEVIDIADKYMKAVLINTKRRYYRVLRKRERYGITLCELEKYESNLIYEENGFNMVDSERFIIGKESIVLEKEELTEALQALSPIQLEILLKSILLGMNLIDIAVECGISERMVQKHKHNALEKLRRRLISETQIQKTDSSR